MSDDDGAGLPAWMGRLLHAVATRGDPVFFGRRPPTAGQRKRQAAVLMLYGPRDGGGEDVVLTQRTAHLRSHAGQVSFPGGRIDATDAGPVAAALREAAEEIDLSPHGVDVLGRMPELFLEASTSAVTPVLAWWDRPTPVRVKSTDEVAAVARIAVADLLDPAHRFTAVHPSGYKGPAFEVDGLFIWGFTAALLSATFDLAGLDGGSWDVGHERDVPFLGPRPFEWHSPGRRDLR
ncbi:MAG: CoA pyrophosphatase [Dermatophilaceae bacterium]